MSWKKQIIRNRPICLCVVSLKAGWWRRDDTSRWRAGDSDSGESGMRGNAEVRHSENVVPGGMIDGIHYREIDGQLDDGEVD